MKTKLLFAGILLFATGAFAQNEQPKEEHQQEETTLFDKEGTRGLGESKKLSKAEEAKLFAAPKGTFTDPRDGKNYRWVKINGQIWMADNLAYLPKVYSKKEAEGGYWVYGNKSQFIEQARANANYKTFGVLYNYQTATKACPPGWRLPMDYDWRKLEALLGFEKEKLMKKGARGRNSEWIKSDRVWGTDGESMNKLGFSAVPSGFYDAGYKKFEQIGHTSTYWSLKVDKETAWCRTLRYKNTKIERASLKLENGFSVRCVKE